MFPLFCQRFQYKGCDILAEVSGKAIPEHFSAYVVIPSSVFFDKSITDKAKLFYGLISCMSNERGYAFPRNETLQRYLGGVSEDTVSRRLKELVNAGAVVVEGGDGGCPKNIRKIYLANLYPDSLRKNAEAPQYKNNKRKNNTTKASEEELCQWVSKWASDLDQPMELTTPLIADFFAFMDSRKAKGKPFLTVRAVSMQANKLTRNTEGLQDTERIARMRYMLRSSIVHNWEEVYPIDERTEPDYFLWRSQEYGISAPGSEETDYF